MTDVLDLISRLERAKHGSVKLDKEVASAIGWTSTPDRENTPKSQLDKGIVWQYWTDPNGYCYNHTVPSFTTSIDTAFQVLPKTTINHHLVSYSSGDRWAFQCHDTAQFMGEQRAKANVRRMMLKFPDLYGAVDSPVCIVVEKGIAEQFLNFGCSCAATAALVICVTALNCRIGRSIEDILFQDEKQGST